MGCKQREKAALDGRVIGWLGPRTFLVASSQGVLTCEDRTGRAQPGRSVTVVKTGEGAWRIA